METSVRDNQHMAGGLDEPSGARSQSVSGEGALEGTVSWYAQGQGAVVVARGAFDMDDIELVSDALESAAREHSPVVLDAEGITFAGSTFLTLLLRANSQTCLRVAAPSQELLQILEMTGALTLLDVHPTVTDALAPHRPA